MTVWLRDSWREARAAYHAQVDAWVAPRLERRAHGRKHPVDDFLFDYYPISPGKLRSWHPGRPVEAMPSDLADFPSATYEHRDGEIRLRPTWVIDHADEIAVTTRLLTATASRSALSGCFGLHEWAMLLNAERPRHEQYPLRVTPDTLRSTIDDVGLRCTHFDAFRFFTEQAAPLNPLQLTRAQQIDTEQPGCLHANMDLYKHAVRLAPLAGSDVVREAFALAREIREVDMRAAPYDLSSLGVSPIPVETTEGRAQFAALQREFAARAASVRSTLLERSGAQVTVG